MPDESVQPCINKDYLPAYFTLFDRNSYLTFTLSTARNILNQLKFNRGTQRPNVSKHAQSVLDGFLYALNACLFNLELP